MFIFLLTFQILYFIRYTLKPSERLYFSGSLSKAYFFISTIIINTSNQGSLIKTNSTHKQLKTIIDKSKENQWNSNQRQCTTFSLKTRCQSMRIADLLLSDSNEISLFLLIRVLAKQSTETWTFLHRQISSISSSTSRRLQGLNSIPNEAFVAHLSHWGGRSAIYRYSLNSFMYGMQWNFNNTSSDFHIQYWM